MKAVILSGGFGTRMRPLTYTTPKPLLPIVNKPMIHHLVDSLPEEVDEVLIAANYKIDLLKDYFEAQDLDINVEIIDEPKPLGTAGAVKNVEEYLNEPFFVMNADVISSIDLKGFLEFFNSKPGVGAISAWRVENPEEFGIFDMDEEKRIQRFEEKPNPWEAFSNIVNAGHYILEPEILDLIQSGEKVNMSKEIFPKLLEKGLYGFEFEGYWIDCGRPSSFFKATRALMDEKEVSQVVGERSVVEGELGDYVCIGGDCTIGDSKISNSIIFDGVEIDDRCVIEDSIIGYDVIIEDDVTIRDSIISDNIYLEEGKDVIEKKLKPEGVE